MNTDDSFIKAPWCAMFVSWCSYEAGTISSTGSFAYCPYWVNHFKNKGQWKSRSSGYYPLAGDIIFFANGRTENSESSHVGIVYESNLKTVYTIEGNTADSCAYRSYSLEDTYIIGYGTPPYAGRVQHEIPDLPTPIPGKRVYVTGYNQKVTAGAAVIADKKFNGKNTVLYNELNTSWASYFVAAPSGTDGKYVITQKGEHLQSGSLTIPEGGIIFASHCDDRDTSSDAYINSRNNKAATNAFKIGDLIVITGINFKTGAVSSTATIEIADNSDNDILELIPDSGLIIDRQRGFLLGAGENCSAEYIRTQFKNSGIIFDKEVIGTGCRVYIPDGNGGFADSLIIIVLGDLTGDGRVSALDYLNVKRAFIGNFELSDAQLCAGCLSGKNSVTANDYFKIKRHFLGTYDIFLK